MERNEPEGVRKVTWKSYRKKHLRLALERCGLLQPGRRLSFARLAAKVEYHVGPHGLLNARKFVAANELELASEARRAKHESEADADDSDEERDREKEREKERLERLKWIEEQGVKFVPYQQWWKSISASRDDTRDYRSGLKTPESRCRRDDREYWLSFCRDPENFQRCRCRSCLDFF